jgi:hypothetical protein
VTILFEFDGSESADAAIAAAGKLFGHDRLDAVVLTVWEPLVVEALRAARFGWHLQQLWAESRLREPALSTPLDQARTRRRVWVS